MRFQLKRKTLRRKRQARSEIMIEWGGRRNTAKRLSLEKWQQVFGWLWFPCIKLGRIADWPLPVATLDYLRVLGSVLWLGRDGHCRLTPMQWLETDPSTPPPCCHLGPLEGIGQCYGLTSGGREGTADWPLFKHRGSCCDTWHWNQVGRSWNCTTQQRSHLPRPKRFRTWQGSICDLTSTQHNDGPARSGWGCGDWPSTLGLLQRSILFQWPLVFWVRETYLPGTQEWPNS